MADENNVYSQANDGDVIGISGSDRVSSDILKSVQSVEQEVKKSNEFLFALTKQERSSGFGRFSLNYDDQEREGGVHRSSFSSRSSSYDSQQQPSRIRRTSSSDTSFMDSVLSGVEDALSEKLGIDDFNRNYRQYADRVKRNLANALNVDEDSLVHDVSRHLSDSVFSKVDSAFSGSLSKAVTWYTDGLSDSVSKGLEEYDKYVESLFGRDSKFSSSNLLRDEEAGYDTSVPYEPHTQPEESSASDSYERRYAVLENRVGYRELDQYPEEWSVSSVYASEVVADELLVSGLNEDLHDSFLSRLEDEASTLRDRMQGKEVASQDIPAVTSQAPIPEVVADKNDTDSDYGDIAESIADSVSSSSLRTLGEDVSSTVGDSLGEVSDAIEDATRASAIRDGMREASDFSESPSGSVASSAFDDASDTAMEGAASAASSAIANGDDIAAVASAAAKGGIAALKSAGPQILATAAVSYLVEGVTDAAEEFSKHASEAVDKISSVADRVSESRWSNMEAQEKRLAQDVETIIQKPFEILEQAAQKVYDVWDSTLRTVTATQGYDKEGLQDLMSSYAARLREEGLSSVVGTTDVTEMLQSIINAGLSGKVAEEFAYQVTVLNNAIPTEDFSSYAPSYASLVSSYIAQGHSQQESLQYANEQLEVFASNVLTASREISGGLTTSLTGVSDLFSEIVRISQTAGVPDTSSLSSALSIVQAVAGQVSPEVGNALVSQIVSAAVGGNSSELVALRSLAGTGASNTAFLQALANNPNKVLAAMFESLSDMFDKSTDNYMEVAYSLAETFGLSADAMTRVDWERLSQELRSNTSSTSALQENLSLLQSGETTTSAESQRLSQINEYMIEEGLAYVLDNEAARAIQQHMWDQQLAEEMQEATYGVEFVGGTWELFESIGGFLYDIVRVLTLGILDLGSTVQSAVEGVTQQLDIGSILEAGKVGQGSYEQLKNLTTYDVEALPDVPSYAEMWNVPSAYKNAVTQNVGNLVAGAMMGPGGIGTALSQIAVDYYNKNRTDSYSAALPASPESMYSWGGTGTGKSALNALSESVSPTYVQGTSSASATEQIQESTSSALNDWIASMSDFVSEGMSFQDWMDSSSDYGFSDAESAVESYGISRSDLERAYAEESTDKAVDKSIERYALEEEFWQKAVNWIEVTYPQDRDNWIQKYDLTTSAWTQTFTDKMSEWSTLFTDTMSAMQENFNIKYSEWSSLYSDSVKETHDKLQHANNEFDSNFTNGFLYDWRDYYIGNHTYYRQASGYEKSLKTINAEKSGTGEAVLALAESLAKNYKDLSDPTVQTNVLLGQILVVLQSLLTATQSGKGLTLPTALASLGLNINTSNTAKK